MATRHRLDYAPNRLTIGLGRFMLIAWSIAALAFNVADARAEVEFNCSERGAGGFGPFDYTNAAHVREHLQIVEAYHFTPKVEQLVSGEKDRADPIDDIAYVLRAFPNHHRALFSMARYHLRIPNPPEPGSRESADCWFYKAMNFKPNDGAVYSLYGYYLHRADRHKEALGRYQQALDFLPESADTHYNLGLLYFDLSDYASSRKHATQAYELGHPLPGLRTKLQKIDQWTETPN